MVQQPGNSGPANGGVEQPGNSNPSRGLVRQPDGTNDEIDLLLMCSDNRSEKAANLKRAFAENLPVGLYIDSKLCTSSQSELKAIIEKKTFTLDDAKRLCPSVLPAVGKWAHVAIAIDDVVYKSVGGVITVLYARNEDEKPANEAADALCDKRSSPLVVHVASDILNPLPIALSSIEDGVLFDLLGLKNNHEPVKISWFTNDEYRMLALPDARGEVHSIDQLFGNATIGPDGLFADNGYAALAKYDGKSADGMFQLAEPDGRIDRDDPIYSKLRLWADKNRDGIGQRSELINLRRAKIAFIDLEYSNDYSEMDKHGNITMMKSVVGYLDGSLDLIFDLWFAFEFGGGK
ncbi:MAG: hypothetical protein HC902_14215 [Calothrix sp. SM1_5_4]|nr:hypothetical protein [Calothrix sp. SM1_5_4]